MAEPKFTRGPWETKQPSKILLGERWLITAPTGKGNRRYTVAVLVDHSTCPEHSATTAADATLIAAAPDLYAACVAVVEWFAGTVGGVDQEDATVLAAVRAAVAKADGS